MSCQRVAAGRVADRIEILEIIVPDSAEAQNRTVQGRCDATANLRDSSQMSKASGAGTEGKIVAQAFSLGPWPRASGLQVEKWPPTKGRQLEKLAARFASQRLAPLRG